MVWCDTVIGSLNNKVERERGRCLCNWNIILWLAWKELIAVYARIRWLTFLATSEILVKEFQNSFVGEEFVGFLGALMSSVVPRHPILSRYLQTREITFGRLDRLSCHLWPYLSSKLCQSNPFQRTKMLFHYNLLINFVNSFLILRFFCSLDFIWSK